MSWQTQRLKTILTETKDTVGTNSSDFQLLSLTKGGVIVRDLSTGKGKFPSDFGTYKIVNSGQIIFCLFDIDETPRTVGLSSHNGMITGAYDVFNIMNANPRFIEYYFLAIDDIKGLKPYYTGLRKTVSMDKFLNISIPLPPREEQDQIVRCLDWKVSQINKLINVKKRQIEMLGEQKRAEIDKALRQNGNGWDIARLKYLCLNIGDIDHKMPEAQDDGIPYVSPKDFYADNGIDFDNAKKITRKSFEELSKKIKPEKGDLILSRYATLGATRLVETDIDFLVSYSCVTIKPNQLIINSAYLYFYFMSSFIEDELRNYAFETTQSNIGIDSIKKFRISYPSDILAQQTVVDYIKSKTSAISNAIETIQKEITLLNEYRTRLISDVVTGKHDVRDVVVPEYESIEDAKVDADDIDEDEAECDNF